MEHVQCEIMEHDQCEIMEHDQCDTIEHHQYETMEHDQSTFLHDLPNEILQKILAHVPGLTVRKNLRLTCRWLYNFCNSDYFCKDEVIVWPEESEYQIISTFRNSTRSYYNLIFKNVNLKNRRVSAFFQRNGAKVHSLVITDCKFSSGQLESIIMHCTALCSLTIRGSQECTFSFAPHIVMRPTVTSLELLIDFNILKQSPVIFHRIILVFPCVRHLSIEIEKLTILKEWKEVRDSIIFDFVMNFYHLESLKLDTTLSALFDRESKFLNWLSKLSSLTLTITCFYHYSSDSWDWETLASRLNIVSIEIHQLVAVYSQDIESLLSITGLNRLTYHSVHKIYLTLEAFLALVSSQLKIIEFQASEIETCNELITDLPIETNETVTDLIILPNSNQFNDQLLVMIIFPIYFRGLIHLQIGNVTDEVLQIIFKYQKNLRSLVLENCKKCSKDGFCGTRYGPFKNSIRNLQKLEYLSISIVDKEILESNEFHATFYFPQLKYLRIIVEWGFYALKNPSEYVIDMFMFKSCLNLQAVRFEGFELSSFGKVTSLFQNRENLNYLRICLKSYENDKSFAYVRSKHFAINFEKLLLNLGTLNVHEIKSLDVILFTKALKKRIQLCSPKISYNTIDWIHI